MTSTGMTKTSARLGAAMMCSARKAATAANPTAVKVEKDDDDCYIVDGPKATKGSKWRTVKEPTTIKKKTIVNKKEATAEDKEFKADKRTPMAYKPPTVTDVTDEDDEDGRVVVDSPNAAK